MAARVLHPCPDRACPRERGQATVEFALVLPLIVFALLAILQVGLVARDQIAVVHAAREAARSRGGRSGSGSRGGGTPGVGEGRGERRGAPCGSRLALMLGVARLGHAASDKARARLRPTPPRARGCGRVGTEWQRFGSFHRGSRDRGEQRWAPRAVLVHRPELDRGSDGRRRDRPRPRRSPLRMLRRSRPLLIRTVQRGRRRWMSSGSSSNSSGSGSRASAAPIAR